MDNPTFHLDGVVKDRNELQDFDGPLSLILMLLSKNKIEIRDIKISEILDQYLEYLDRMEKMDLEITSEFVQMASHLLYIKTRTLLAGEEEVSELEELMTSLEQLKCKDIYSAVQRITPELKKASEKGLLYYAKLPEPMPDIKREYEYRHEPADLFRALYTVITRGGNRRSPSLLTVSRPRASYMRCVQKAASLSTVCKRDRQSCQSFTPSAAAVRRSLQRLSPFWSCAAWAALSSQAMRATIRSRSQAAMSAKSLTE